LVPASDLAFACRAVPLSRCLTLLRISEASDKRHARIIPATLARLECFTQMLARRVFAFTVSWLTFVKSENAFSDLQHGVCRKLRKNKRSERMSETYLHLMLPTRDMHELVSDMRRQGYNVENTPLGYVCHETTRNGLVMVLSAMKGATQYRVKANTAFFDGAK
jgi:hypothetical protein